MNAKAKEIYNAQKIADMVHMDEAEQVRTETRNRLADIYENKIVNIEECCLPMVSGKKGKVIKVKDVFSDTGNDFYLMVQPFTLSGKLSNRSVSAVGAQSIIIRS